MKKKIVSSTIKFQMTDHHSKFLRIIITQVKDMGLKEADESKLLSRLEKLGRDVSALRFQVMLLLMED